jgi:hypothetical protein
MKTQWFVVLVILQVCILTILLNNRAHRTEREAHEAAKLAAVLAACGH